MSSLVDLTNNSAGLEINVKTIGASSVISSGNISCVDVVASGNVGCVDVNATGDLSGVNVDASGNVGCVDVNATGDLSCVNVTCDVMNLSDINIATLSAGGDSVGIATVGVVPCTKVTASSKIFCTYSVAGGRTEPLDVTVISNGVSFTVTGDAGATFFYLVIN